MEQNPDLSDMDVSERPTDVIKGGTVTEVVKGTRAEIFLDEENDVSEADDPQYGSWADTMVQITIEVETEDGPIPVYDTYRYYDNPSDRSSLGSYLEKYGTPEPGQDVKVDFDDEGNAVVRGTRNQ